MERGTWVPANICTVTRTRLEPDRLNTGITLVGRNARVPGGVTIGRNVLIAPNVDEEHFTSTTIASGESVDRLATALLS